MGSGERYRAAHGRFVDVMRDVDDDVAVPATPEWTAGVLLSHVVGVATDLAEGRVDQWAQPAWTAAQVSARVGRSRDKLLAEWDEHLDRVVAIVDDPASAGLDDMYSRVPLIDLVAHEHDLREAVGAVEPLADDDWAILRMQRQLWLNVFVSGAGLPPLRVTSDRGDDWLVGGETPAGTVHAPRQDLWRSMEGRRPRADVRAFAWSVDPEPYLACWLGPAFTWPDD